MQTHGLAWGESDLDSGSPGRVRLSQEVQGVGEVSGRVEQKQGGCVLGWMEGRTRGRSGPGGVGSYCIERFCNLPSIQEGFALNAFSIFHHSS